MTIALLLAALVLIVAGFLWLLDRKDSRAHAEREANRREREILANRIQAPETAVAQTIDAQPTPREKLFVPFDDDDAFHAAVGAN